MTINEVKKNILNLVLYIMIEIFSENMLLLGIKTEVTRYKKLYIILHKCDFGHHYESMIMHGKDINKIKPPGGHGNNENGLLDKHRNNDNTYIVEFQYFSEITIWILKTYFHQEKYKNQIYERDNEKINSCHTNLSYDNSKNDHTEDTSIINNYDGNRENYISNQNFYIDKTPYTKTISLKYEQDHHMTSPQTINLNGKNIDSYDHSNIERKRKRNTYDIVRHNENIFEDPINNHEYTVVTKR